MQPLIISAPFGNYVRPRGSTPTLGTFTAQRRRGRVWRVLATVRYSPRMRAWVNKIGLRNPGIDWLAKRVHLQREDVSQAIVSIHGFADDDWWLLLDRVAELRPLGVELNMSCPNVGEVNWPEALFERAVSACGATSTVIVKLPPVNYRRLAQDALASGVRALHCCNTLPVPAGGVSGKPLKPVSLQCIGDLRERIPQDTVIIGGGGITVPRDIDDYVAAGVQHVAIGTKAFNPRCLWSEAPLRPLIDHAASVLSSGGAQAN
jgi:dihydroorotate dehydrogenase